VSTVAVKEVRESWKTPVSDGRFGHCCSCVLRDSRQERNRIL
jgi:hypothetical protein